MNEQKRKTAPPLKAKRETTTAHFSFLPLIFGLSSALLFGLATPASKILLGELNTFLLAGLLYLGAAIGVSPIVYLESHRTPSRNLPRSLFFFTGRIFDAQARYIIGAIVCGGFLGPLLLLQGLKTAQASSVAIWLNLELVATAILGVLFFKDHLGRNGWTAVILATAAGAIMTLSEGTAGLSAALMVTLACFCWGLDNHFTALIDKVSAARITLYKGIFAGSFSTVVGLISSQSSPGFFLVGKALLLGTICYGASIVLYVSCAHHSGATRAQILFSSSPFFGVGLSLFMLGEQFSSAHFLALGCLAAAVYFSQRTSHSHQHTHQPLGHTHLHSHNDDHHDHDHDGLDLPVYNGLHSHHHIHGRLRHSHPHYPDLHHRHNHEP